MAEINDLDITDASNTARFPEKQAASSVNNGARALEGIIARWHEDTNGSVASTGSANAYLFAAKQTLSAYYDGLTITFDANFTNTGAATLDVDSVSADAIVWPDQGVLTAGDIVSGAKTTVRHDGTSWQLVTAARSQSVYVSPLQSISNAGGATLAHGLGVEPSRVDIVLQCSSAQHSYGVGDRILIHDAGSSVVVVKDATNLIYRYLNSATPFNYLNGTSGAIVALTSASWDMELTAHV